MNRLPKWCITDKFPALYDTESATAIEMVAKVYGAINELIDDYNAFVDRINTEIEAFEASSEKNYELFTISIRQEFQDFIDTIELKVKAQDKAIADKFAEQDTTISNSIKAQDTKIANAITQQNAVIADTVVYMKTELHETITTLIAEMRANGELTQDILTAFDDLADRINSLEVRSDKQPIDVTMLGVDNTGATDCSSVLNEIFNTKEGFTLYFPKGVYKVGNPLIVNARCNLLLDNNARIYAVAEMECLLSYNPNKTNGVSVKNFIKGGCFDGNDKANTIIGLEWYTNFTIDDVKIYNFKKVGIQCMTDTTGESHSHGGLMVSRAYLRNWNNAYAGSIGILNNAQDNKFFDNVIVDVQIGIDTNFATVRNIHHWISKTEILADSIFCVNRNSYTTIESCCIDTVCTAVKSVNCQTRISNCTMFMNPLFYTEEFASNVVATFAKREGTGYVYAINNLCYLNTGSGKASDYTTTMDVYFGNRFTPDTRFDLSNYLPLDNFDCRIIAVMNDDVNTCIVGNRVYKVSGGNANLPSERTESGLLVVHYGGNPTAKDTQFVTQIYYPQSTPHCHYERRYTLSTQTFSAWSKYSGTLVE